MKEIKNNKKKGFFKKIFIKVCRIFGFEIIDQSNFRISTMNKNINENLSVLGKKSINIPLGEVQITRRVKSLDVIIRTCMEVDMLTQTKKRIFEKEKSEYTLRTINSLIRSYLNGQSLRQIEVNFTVVDHNSTKENLEKIKKLFKSYNISYNFVELDVAKFVSNIKKKNEENKEVTKNQISNMSNIHQSLLLSKNCKDLVYFVEDDYIHKKESLEEMVFSYERISSMLNSEIFICSADYPFLYNKINDTKVLLGSKYHWRKIDETLCSFLTSKKMINKHFGTLENMCKFEHYPFEKPIHRILKEEICISPIPALSYHCTNINSVYGLSPNLDWQKIWDENEVN